MKQAPTDVCLEMIDLMCFLECWLLLQVSGADMWFTFLSIQYGQTKTSKQNKSEKNFLVQVNGV